MTHRTLSTVCVAVLAVLLALVAGRAFPQEGSQVLNRPFPYDVDRTEAPLQIMGEFLRDAGLSGGGGVLVTDCEDAPLLPWKATQGSSFRQVLDDFQTANPAYRWELRGNLLNVVPASGIPALLATKIPSFELQTTDQATPASLAFQKVVALPEIGQAAAALHLKEGVYQGGLTAAPGPGSAGAAPKASLPINLQLKDVSFQDALNSIAQTYGHTMRWYRERSCQGDVTYVVEDSQSY